jgi:hypothetical protein
MRTGVISSIVILILAGLLALRGTSDTTRDWIDAAERHTSVLKNHVGLLADRWPWGRTEAESRVATVGPTYALVSSGGLIVGVDREGRVTMYDSVCDMCGVPFLTGCTSVDVERGQLLSTPEVVLGLSIIRAFEERPHLMNMLSEVNTSNLEQPRVILSGGIVAELGQGRYRAKIRRLSQIIMQAPRLKMRPESVDLRFGRQVIVKCGKIQHLLDKEV